MKHTSLKKEHTTNTGFTKDAQGKREKVLCWQRKHWNVTRNTIISTQDPLHAKFAMAISEKYNIFKNETHN